MNILVIEDDPSVRIGITDLLIEEGFNVEEAENGLLGVQAAKKNIPDLIISDILMPGLDGYGVLSELQKDSLTASIPLIFLTAKTESSDITKGINLGASDYLSKPYSADVLLNVVNTKLQKFGNFSKSCESVGPAADQFPPEGYGMPEEMRSGRVENLICTNEMGKNKMEKEQKIKNSSIGNVHEFIARFASQTAYRHNRGNDLEINLAPGGIKISEEYLRAIIEEVIGNSIKFSINGSPIKISSKIDNNLYYIFIKDFGIGFSPEHLKNIDLMEHPEGIQGKNGFGIGLSLVKKLISIHCGTLEIESQPGLFTTVTIGIPLAD